MTTLPTRELRPDIQRSRLEAEAQKLLDGYLAGEHESVAEVNIHHRDADPNRFSLIDAQFTLARAYGFESWPKLAAYVDGASMAALAEAVRANDLDQVRAMLHSRPELVRLHMAENNEHQALHYAVMARLPEMTRLLMQHGADPGSGIYPNRDATTPLTIAIEREYDDIVAIIREEQNLRPGHRDSPEHVALPPSLLEAAQSRDESRLIAELERHPEFINVPYYLMAPLHMAAARCWPKLAEWLLDHGADVNFRDRGGPSPLELVGANKRQEPPERMAALETLLLRRGAHMSARAAIMLGDAGWLKQRHAEGTLEQHVPVQQDSRGLLEIAVMYNRPEILRLLLDLGFDPEDPFQKPGSEEIIRGEPLRACVENNRPEMAEMLIERGAEVTPSIAIVLGKADWLKQRHAEGKLENALGEEGGLVSLAVKKNRPDMLKLLLDLGFDPDEKQRMNWMDVEAKMYASGGPLRWCAENGKYELAVILLDRGADPNAWDYPGPPIWKAMRERDDAMVALLERRGAVANPTSVAMLRDTGRARKMLEDYDAGRLRTEGFWERGELPVLFLDSGASGGDPEIVKMALVRIDWPRGDIRWSGPLKQPLGFYHEVPWIRSPKWPLSRATYFECFRLILERSGASFPPDGFGKTILHEIAAMREWITDAEVLQFATAALDAGAGIDVRDDLLNSTPLGWACRWGRVGMAKLLISRGADIEETDAEPWARPRAWARKMNHPEILTLLG